MSCPHGMPSPASCLDCMDDGPVEPPKLEGPLPAERWHTATFHGSCARRRCEVEPGDRIGMVEGVGWCCTGCAL